MAAATEALDQASHPTAMTDRMSDRIRVQGIEFHGFHGVSVEERAIGHRYRVDLFLELDLRPSAGVDDVALTVDYGAVAALVVRLGTGPGMRLVETLAERIAASLLVEFPRLDAVEVRAAKLHPPCPTVFEAAIIEIRRSRTPFSG